LLIVNFGKVILYEEYCRGGCKQIAKRDFFIWLGEKLPTAAVSGLLDIASSLELGRWIATSGHQCNAWLPNRKELFAAMASDARAYKRTLYLEFGVYTGETMRMWSALLPHSTCLLHGFDSFQGLPENWVSRYPKGSYCTGGNVPNIDDSRVSFFPGFFEATLQSYEVPNHDLMIVNCDADLYSSTITILNRLKPHFRSGDFLYFDEFNVPLHEARAFRTFVQTSGLRFSLFGSTPGYNRVAFRCDGLEP
jgi:hypothetical protein